MQFRPNGPIGINSWPGWPERAPCVRVVDADRKINAGRRGRCMRARSAQRARDPRSVRGPCAANVPLPIIGSTRRKFIMSKAEQNKKVVAKWFKEFWGNPWNPKVVDELAAPNILLKYSLHEPRRGRNDVKEFMAGFREAFPDLEFGGTADLIAEGDYVVGRWEGGGTHTGPAFDDFVMGALPAASGRKMRFSGITVLRVEGGKIAEEVGLDDGLTAMQQLGIVRAAA
jgi:predicted ester cyclase